MFVRLRLSLHPLWTLRINRVSRVYFRFRIQSYVPLLTVRRITELTRNPSFHFNIVMQFQSGFVSSFHIYKFILYLQTFYLIATYILKLKITKSNNLS